MIGARDLAFPRLNLLSWYIYMLGGLFTLVTADRRAAWIPAGRSTRLTAAMYSNTHVVPTAIGVFVAGFSSILTGLNFIVTIHKMRAPGHDLVSPAAVRLGALRHQPDPGAGHAGAGDHAGAAGAGAGLARRHFRPGARRRSRCSSSISSGSTRIPAVYIMILPGMGVVSELITCFCPQDASSATSSSRSPAWRSRCSAFWCGAITCSSAASRCTPGWSSRF